jgi:pimeloyl-ACP methyl ester carboxylesterase/putative sterol carrier protein
MTVEIAQPLGPQGVGNLTDVLVESLKRSFDTDLGIEGKVTLDVSDGDPWTLRFEDGDIALSSGKASRSDTTVITDSATMISLLNGSRSGIEAFLAGDLRVRGSLALSLKLSGSLVDADAPRRIPRARAIVAGGIDTFYLEAGTDDPIILLHGLAATNASMLTTLWDLATDYRVIAPDLPGCGASAKPVRPYHAAFFARWLTDFLDDLGIERCHLVGNSLGGRVALEVGMRMPERVNRLVLLAPSPAFLRRREFVRLVGLLRPELALLPVPVGHDRVRKIIRSMFAKPDRLPGPWYDAAADEFLRVFSSPRGRIAFFSAARQIYLEEPHGEEGFWDRLPSMKRPALFVWGDRDWLVPARFERHVVAAIPGARSVVFEDCGHVPQYEHPDRTHGLIREFLGT